MSDIVVVGSLNMDLVVRVPRIPVPGETILGRNLQMVPGGKGANQAIAASRLGGKVTMIGRIGDDAFGAKLKKNLVREEVNTTHISVDASAASGIAMISVDENGQNSIVVASGANMRLTPDDVEAAWDRLTRTPKTLVLQLEIPIACVERAAQLAKSEGALVILNPAPARTLSTSLLAAVDILVPNESELALLTGLPVGSIDSVDKTARTLLEAGLGTPIVTLGEKGALIIGEEGSFHFPAPKVKAVDTTAAGDTFVGALAAALTEGKPMREAVKFANFAAALSVTKSGAQPSLPTAKDVYRFMAEKN